MAGGIWEAIGAALQQGNATYQTASRQQAAAAEDAERLKLAQEQEKRQAAYQAEQLKMQQSQDAQATEDRKRKQLHDAISDYRPEDSLDPSLVDNIRTEFPDIMSRINTKQGHSNINVVDGIDKRAPANASWTPESYTRKTTIAEDAAQEQLNTTRANRTRQDQLLSGLQGGAIKDTPYNRALVSSTLPGVTATEVFGPGGKADPTSTDALVQTIVADPTGQVYKNLPAALRSKIAPALAAAGYDFKEAPPAPSAYSVERQQRVLQSIDELEQKVNGWTTGLGGVVLSHIPGTAAKDFAAELKTLAANIAFNELTEMRAASKTGGALGQVSDREGQLLQSALGAIEQDQSPANVKAQFAKIRGSIERWNAARAQNGAAPVAAPEGAEAPRSPQATQKTPGQGAPQAPAFNAQNFKPVTGHGAAAPAAAAPPTAARSMTIDQVNRYARAKNVPPAEMAKLLAAQGVRIQGLSNAQ